MKLPPFNYRQTRAPRRHACRLSGATVIIIAEAAAWLHDICERAKPWRSWRPSATVAVAADRFPTCEKVPAGQMALIARHGGQRRGNEPLPPLSLGDVRCGIRQMALCLAVSWRTDRDTVASLRAEPARHLQDLAKPWRSQQPTQLAVASAAAASARRAGVKNGIGPR